MFLITRAVLRLRIRIGDVEQDSFLQISFVLLANLCPNQKEEQEKQNKRIRHFA